MLYEKLNANMKEMVDGYAGRLRMLSWNRRSDLLVEAARSFGEDLPPDKAPTAARGFITAVLERLEPEALEPQPVNDPFQASLYLASLDPDHRQAAEDYLEANPEMQAAVQAGLSGTYH
jgi:hypothetical protein